jgi:hypothetical protein
LSKRRYIIAPLLLLTLFLTYQVSITLFTHVHIVNGVMIVHSHPSSGKHHTHTTGQVISIAHLSTIHTLEAEVQAEMTVFRPLLYVLEYKINTFRAKRFARNVSICALLLFIAETKVYLLMEYIRAIPLADGNVFLP